MINRRELLTLPAVLAVAPELPVVEPVIKPMRLPRWVIRKVGPMEWQSEMVWPEEIDST